MRSVLALFSGIIVAIVIITIVQMINAQMYPADNLNFSDPAIIEIYLSELPLSAFIIILLSYIFGSLTGGFIIARIAGKWPILISCVLGLILTIFGLINLYKIPHPLWFGITSSLIYIPFSYFGALLGGRNRKQKII